MLKKVFILALMAFNVFTLTNISADVPDGYQVIVFDTWGQPNPNIAVAGDTVYQDLWSFINFRESFIDIDGVTVVANGEPIPDVTFQFKVDGGNYFQLNYDGLIYRFALENVDYSDVGFFANNTVVITNETSGDPVPGNITLNLYLPDQSFISNPEAEGGFLELLVGYGLYNPVGLLIVFAVVLLIANISLAFLQMPSIVYIAVNLAIGTGFLAFNFIPFWAGFIFLSVIALFLILSIRGSRL